MGPGRLRNFIRSNRNQIVFTTFRLILNQTDQINRKKVNTIWDRFDLIIPRKDFSVCRHNHASKSSISKILAKYSDIYQWYFINIFLEMSYITFYSANSRQFFVPVPGSRVLNSVVYGGLYRLLFGDNKIKVTIKLSAWEDIAGKSGKVKRGK